MLTTGHTCAAPGDGAEPGEQPGKRPSRSVEAGSTRPEREPKRQRDRKGKKGGKSHRQRDRQDRTVRTLCTSSFTCQNGNSNITSNNSRSHSADGPVASTATRR